MNNPNKKQLILTIEFNAGSKQMEMRLSKAEVPLSNWDLEAIAIILKQLFEDLRPNYPRMGPNTLPGESVSRNLTPNFVASYFSHKLPDLLPRYHFTIDS